LLFGVLNDVSSRVAEGGKPLTEGHQVASFRHVSTNGGDLASTGSVMLWLRVQVLSPGKSLGKLTTANTELALAA
jgi:hypothetical protein